MGLYTESIKERDRIDRELERGADIRIQSRLRGSMEPGMNDSTQFALNHILSAYGMSAREVHGYEDISEMLDMMLDPLGIIYEEVDLTDPAWIHRNDRMLAFLEDGSVVALEPTVHSYKCFYPETGKKKRVTRDMKFRDTAYAIPRPIQIRSVTTWSMCQYLMSLVSPRDIIAIGTATILVTLLGLVTPRMNQYVLQDIVPLGTDGYGILMRSLALFLAAGVIRAGLYAIKNLSLGQMRVRIASDAQSAVMTRVLLLPQRFFLYESTGKLSRQITNARYLSDQIIGFVMGASLTTFFSLVYLQQLASFSVKLLVPAIVILIIQTAFSLLAGHFYAENESNRQAAEMDERAFTYTALKGIQRIKESGAERRIYAGWTKRYQDMLACDMDQPAIIKLESVIISFLSSLTTVLLVSLIVPNGIDRADYIAFTASFALLTSVVTDLTDAQRKIVMMKPMMMQLNHILSVAPEDSENKIVVSDLKGNIQLDKVSFSYEGSSAGCLNNISLHIHAGEKVAIVGESGCGKSTLLRMILGVLKPDSGSVTVDGMLLDTVNLRSMRRNIGSVTQASRIMPGTIYSNIAFGSRKVSLEDAKIAAEKAALSETIAHLPLGYETEISDSNSGGFSGGQRQRVLLARCFASRPGLMILDEATSALDNITQSKVLESVYAEKCTVIMVAHRLSTVKNCDKIIVLSNGSISEEGTFEELMEAHGEFYELMRRQSA